MFGIGPGLEAPLVAIVLYFCVTKILDFAMIMIYGSQAERACQRKPSSIVAIVLAVFVILLVVSMVFPPRGIF
jgi:hypothetical protein